MGRFEYRLYLFSIKLLLPDIKKVLKLLQWNNLKLNFVEIIPYHIRIDFWS